MQSSNLEYLYQHLLFTYIFNKYIQLIRQRLTKRHYLCVYIIIQLVPLAYTYMYTLNQGEIETQ